MGIEDHEFSDEDVTLREAMEDSVLLDCKLTDIDDMQYIEINIDDVIALAKHFGIDPTDIL